MKKQVSIFDKIDNYYEKQPNPNLFYMSIFLCVFLFGYLIYDYTYESSEIKLLEEQELLDKARDELNTLNNNIEREKRDSQIQRLSQEIIDKEKIKKDIENENGYFDQKLKKVSKLLYNQKNWSEFMYKINSLTKQYDLKLGDLKSSVNNTSSQKVEEVFNVNFTLDGYFQNILHFINSLEKSIDVVDVNKVRIFIPENKGEKDENKPVSNKIQAELKISIWGIKY